MPVDDYLGMFSYGDAPAAMGRGTGAFTWYEDRTYMFKFIEKVLPFSPLGPSNIDPHLAMNAVSNVIKDMRDDALPLGKVRENINESLKGFSQIEWWGTFRELRSGICPYSQKLINDFRQLVSVDENINKISTDPISDNELARFKDYLMTYGI